MNALVLKALLLDTIIYLKTGKHTSPNYKIAKRDLCDQLGQKHSITAKQLLAGIGLVYRDNGLEDKFWAIIDKFGAAEYLN